MFYVYVIKSIHYDFYYKGHCENLEERLKQHNSGMTKSIRPYIPFTIVYSEEFHPGKKPSTEKYISKLPLAEGLLRKK